MQTFTSRGAAYQALRQARLDTLPVEFTTINGQVQPTVLCVFQREVEAVRNRGFNARLHIGV